MDRSITNLEKVSNYFSLATYHYKNQGHTFANMLIPKVLLVNKQWKMLRQLSNLSDLIRPGKPTDNAMVETRVRHQIQFYTGALQ